MKLKVEMIEGKTAIHEFLYSKDYENGESRMGKTKKVNYVEGIEVLHTAWRTSDGYLYSNGDVAEAHQIELNFDQLIKDHTIIGDIEGSRVDPNDLKDWLKCNSALVIEYCKQFEEED